MRGEVMLGMPKKKKKKAGVYEVSHPSVYVEKSRCMAIHSYLVKRAYCEL